MKKSVEQELKEQSFSIHHKFYEIKTPSNPLISRRVDLRLVNIHFLTLLTENKKKKTRERVNAS